MNHPLFGNEHGIKAHALEMWANYIETGKVTQSRQDAERSGGTHYALDDDQIQFVRDLRALALEERKLS